jgi:AAA+ superfamily predicted ATPase
VNPSAGLNPQPPGLGPRPSTLPPWHPAWARDLADLYFSETTSLFLLHGNVHDLVGSQGPDGLVYCDLSEFLATQVFGSWDVVLEYDLGGGLQPIAGGNGERLQEMVRYLTSRMGGPNGWPRDPDSVLLLLDKFIERMLVEEEPARRKSMAIILDYAQYLVPTGDLGSMARGQGTNLVRMLEWAQNPYIKRMNMAFCLIADKLSEINDRLEASPHVAPIEIPLPDRAAREDFAKWMAGKDEFAQLADFAPETLADLSNGLTLVNLHVALSQARQSGQRLDAMKFRQLKKGMIERQCQGLVEFVEPPHTLDMIVGQEAAKGRLREDAKLILGGELQAAPMGYLLCGPVGTGKTFLAECYAGSIGIPCVTLRNFRSKYVGETEGNLEQILRVLRSLGPVVVIVDEADAALGSRQSEGDSGTSARVFSMVASQMGDTRYRGKIIWMLLTSRPDLLPIDLKRQGRAEVHIPMFYPQDDAELKQMFTVMARKNKASLAADAVPDVKAERHLSGADVESVVLAAKRRVLTAGRKEITREDLEQAMKDFIPSAQGLEKEMQELAAVLECTQLSFLPTKWRDVLSQPDGRSKTQERMVAIRQILKD